MADFRKLVGHTLKWEGGLSADPRDTGALRYGHSGKYVDPKYPAYPVHTNKGVIWATYTEYKKKKKQTPNADEFIAMPQAVWLDIYKTLFWDSVWGDQIKSQAIAEILMEAKWGGGNVGLKRVVERLQKVVGAPIDGSMGRITIDALNKYTKNKAKETALADELLGAWLAHYKAQGAIKWSTYGNGWTNRLNELKNRAYDTIAKGLASNKGKALVGAVVLASLAYLYRDKLSLLYKKAIKTLR
jgi:lysozyme family protein